MKEEQILDLLNKYKQNTLTDAELHSLEVWYQSLHVGQGKINEEEIRKDEFAAQMFNVFIEELNKKKQPAPLRALKFRKKLLSVAAILTGISLLGYFTYHFMQERHKSPALEEKIIKNDLGPARSNKAFLVLADGSRIELDSSGTGLLAVQDDVNVIKKGDGQITYSGTAKDVVRYNTINVPKGSKPFQLALADGSKVWLNVASSITFPTAFAGAERRVTINGEAYFEIAKNAEMPFYVEYGGVTTKVLGTHFNINCYNDEKNIQVTLLEGAINVSTGNRANTLKPGQQASVREGNIEVVDNANIQSVMAWKNGIFYFDGADIKTIMRQVEKWYDVEVNYQSEIKNSFVAKIARDQNLSELLKILELTNLVHFEIKGRTITVKR